MHAGPCHAHQLGDRSRRILDMLEDAIGSTAVEGVASERQTVGIRYVTERASLYA
jgi:hypothetical protein